MSHQAPNPYRKALDVLRDGRDLLVESLAHEILDRADEIRTNSFLFHEMLETHGARLQGLAILAMHLEQAAETIEASESSVSVEVVARPPFTPPDVPDPSDEPVVESGPEPTPSPRSESEADSRDAVPETPARRSPRPKRSRSKRLGTQTPTAGDSAEGGSA